MSEQTVSVATADVEAGNALSEDQTEFVRRIFVAVMRRGLRRITNDLDVSAAQYSEAERSIQEWADIALSEDARWMLN